MWNGGWHYGMTYGLGDSNWWWWSMGLHSIFWVVLIALILFAAVHALRGGTGDRTKDRALMLLTERYVTGEIGNEEYLAKKKDILG